MAAVKSWFYFAYGFNLNLTEMRKKCPEAKVVGIGYVKGYRLAFFEHAVVWDSAMETLFPDPAAEVWGVLYELDQFEWETLDCFEDARMDGTGAYFHYPVTVTGVSHKLTTANVYLKARWGADGLPSTEYMQVILAGARQQGLPEEYIKQLQSLKTKPAAYPVPKRPSGSRFPVGGGECSGCDVLL